MATKKERRIAILKDVLLQIKAEKFKATQGVYVVLPKELSKAKDLEQYTDAQKKLKSCTKACKVCAKGAIFLSQVRKENNVKMGELYWDDYIGDGELYHTPTAKVIELFGQDNLNKIEAAFEKWFYIVKYDSDDYNSYSNYKGDTLTPRKRDEKLYNFAKQYPNKTERLVAIIKNCIKNDGIFKP